MNNKELEILTEACEELENMSQFHNLVPHTAETLLNDIVANEETFKNYLKESVLVDEKELEKITSETDKIFLIYEINRFKNKYLNPIINTITDPIGTITTVPADCEAETSIEAEMSTDQNKKEFIKEVLDGVPRKKYLKDYLDDYDSYKQFRDDVERALLYMNWDKIHRVMKQLKWKWFKWEDEFGDEHYNTVPSIYGIREFVVNMIKRMEEDIRKHPEQKNYLCACGGFEVEMWVCDVDEDPDDYEHQVRIVIRFVLEQFDNGI